MALEFIIPKQEKQEDCGSFVLDDTTVYGAPNDDRVNRANTLFVTKTDKDGVRTLLPIVPNSADPLVVSQWTVSITLDGWIEKLLASVLVYNGVTNYVSGDVLYYNGVFYKANQAVTGTPPPSAEYDVITAASLYTDELANTSIDWAMLDDLITCRTEDKLSGEHERVADDFFASNENTTDYNEADKIDSLLNAAQGALLNGRPADAERIIRGIENYILRYGAV